MARYREIRARIKGVENTAKITSAMKMVAAAKLRRAQDAIIAARPYGAKLRELLRFLASTTDTENLFFEERKTVKRVAMVVISADRGLCGAFNSNVIRTANNRIRSEYAELNAAGNLDLFCVGKRCVDFYRKRDYNVAGAWPGVFAELNFSTARTIVERVTAGFQEGEFDRVELIYNEFKSAASSHIAVDQFLPVPKIEPSKGEEVKYVDYIFEPSVDELLAALLPKHLNTQLWNALLESNAAEQGARMAAMENATSNAKDLIRDLRLVYNKARQAAITTEILEIVSGAEALKKS